ncbi:potassium channel family protein [Vibrio sp. OPT18]|uniref:potassium channel family protein n=1 Tax=Vibrio sp. OPT18 TaxID=2778641 RepID=UPI00188281A7|nr:potassium channel family protein [Vibrio sp. OPT18]MBE8577468.1 two pore domain potassium channel family protein [Vibrio sp. OPT18]
MDVIFSRKAYVYALAYLSLIPIFAIVFSMVDLDFGSHNQGWITYFYFSIVSITTLGYGDVLPSSSWAQIAAATESLLGILLIGLFLNALSIQHTQEIEKKELERIEDQNKKRAIARFTSFERLVSLRKQRYLTYCTPITVPSSQDRKEANRYFEFQDMRDLFKSTMRLTDNNFTPAIDYYFENLTEFTEILEELVKLGYASKWPDMEDLCVGFIRQSKSLDFRESILKQPTTTYGDKKASEEDAKTIADYTGKVEFKPSNIINQYVALYLLLKASFDFIDNFERKSDEIKNS